MSKDSGCEQGEREPSSVKTVTLRITDMKAVSFPEDGPRYGTTLRYRVNGRAVEWLDVQFPGRGWIHTPGYTGRIYVDGKWRQLPNNFVRADELVSLLYDVLSNEPLPRHYPDREIEVEVYESNRNRLGSSSQREKIKGVEKTSRKR